ncbi:hypothetical protein [Streptomyces celluloflavus]|uniref:hypothetical protein n=1 Tax=Streptomyces celluloflavus TaxID=58344 RepID=UPI00368BD3BC
MAVGVEVGRVDFEWLGVWIAWGPDATMYWMATSPLWMVRVSCRIPVGVSAFA